MFVPADGIECVDSGWLTCQTEIRLRLHHSQKSPVSITKKKFKNSRFRYAHRLLSVTQCRRNKGSASEMLDTAYGEVVFLTFSAG